MSRLSTLAAAIALVFLGYFLHRPLTVVQLAPNTCTVDSEELMPLVPLGLAEHTYRDDGLLEVTLDGRHPIYDLIERAERDWAEKHRRASRTLTDAVSEYTRRYKRSPPRGFEKWWDYVQKHNVQLPDEYDQIHRDLERYWGMDPADLRQLYADLEARKTDFVVLLKDSSGYFGMDNMRDEPDSGHEPAWDVMDMLAEVEQHLPPFRAIFTHDDRPNRLMEFDIEDALMNAIQNKKELHTSDLPPSVYRGWPAACSPKSPARTMTFNLDDPVPPKPSKSFIYDHRLSMDACMHPDLLWTHGQFVSHDHGPGAQPAMIPEFAWCSSTLHHDITVPTFYGWVGNLSDDVRWEDKVDERLVWRGANTGMGYADDTRWKGAHRTTLLEKTNAIAGTVDVLSPLSRDERVGNPQFIRNAFLNPSMYDVGLAGPPSCSGSVCAYFEEHYPSKNRHSDRDTSKYKYIIDVDGNGWSGRFKRLMTSNALVFKSTIYAEWFVDRLQPWMHYVPVQVDLSDLHDAMVFFRGGLDGKGGHDGLAKRLATQGKEWSQSYWRKEDMIAYLFRLFLEYGRVMSIDRESMSFTG